MACVTVWKQLSSSFEPLACSLIQPIRQISPSASLERSLRLVPRGSFRTPRIPLPLSCCSVSDNQAQIKIGVGPVNKLTRRVFLINRKLGPSSDIIVGGNADRASRVNQMFASKQRREPGQGGVIYGGGVKVGDLLRATTMVNVVVDLLWLRAPQRVVVFFEVDGRPWAEAMGAIQTSFVADGPVTLILERERASIS